MKDLSIALLSLAVLILAAMLYRKESRPAEQAPTKTDDKLNLAEYEKRQEQHDREIRMEGNGRR